MFYAAWLLTDFGFSDSADTHTPDVDPTVGGKRSYLVPSRVPVAGAPPT